MDRCGEPWTEADLRLLKDILAGGLSMREAAHQLGRTEEATRTQAAKAGLLRPRSGSI